MYYIVSEVELFNSLHHPKVNRLNVLRSFSPSCSLPPLLLHTFNLDNLFLGELESRSGELNVHPSEFVTNLD